MRLFQYSLCGKGARAGVPKPQAGALYWATTHLGPDSRSNEQACAQLHLCKQWVGVPAACTNGAACTLTLSCSLCRTILSPPPPPHQSAKPERLMNTVLEFYFRNGLARLLTSMVGSIQLVLSIKGLR